MRFKEEIAVAMLVFALSSVKFKMAQMYMEAERLKVKPQAQVVSEKKEIPEVEASPLMPGSAPLQ